MGKSLEFRVFEKFMATEAANLRIKPEELKEVIGAAHLLLKKVDRDTRFYYEVLAPSTKKQVEIDMSGKPLVLTLYSIGYLENSPLNRNAAVVAVEGTATVNGIAYKFYVGFQKAVLPGKPIGSDAEWVRFFGVDSIHRDVSAVDDHYDSVTGAAINFIISACRKALEEVTQDFIEEGVKRQKLSKLSDVTSRAVHELEGFSL